MLKQNKIIQNEYTCDYSGVTEVMTPEQFEKSDWYSLKVMSRLGSRMFTNDKQMIERTIKAYTEEKHFCSKDALVAYLHGEVALLVQEIRPPANRSSKQVELTP